MEQSTDAPVIIVSTASPDNARVIAKELIGQRIAACVNTTGVVSFYNWNGEFCEDTEVLMVIKTMESRKSRAMDVIRQFHTYDLPEMITVPVTGGYPPYLAWLVQEASGKNPQT